MAASLELVLSLLKHSLKVLVVDDDERVLDMVTGYLEMCSLFDVTPVKTVDEARTLAARQAWHCWLADLYVPELDDGLNLMRDYARAIPMIVLSGRSTGSDGYRCGELSILGFIDKTEIRGPALVERVYQICLYKTMCTRYPYIVTCGRRDEEPLKVLELRRPESVAEWASMLSVSSRTLEQWAGECSAYKPSTMLALFHLYRIAFARSMLRRHELAELSEREQAIVDRYAERPARLRSLIARTVQSHQ
ncbi:MAG: response regulator [Chitinivibrionales bacterium]|nr:response regulator [Chitinivibrionales bacterium]